MKWCRHATVTLIVVAAWPAAATVRIEKRAVELGYRAGNCDFCHTFDLAHMRKGKDKESSKVDTNCYPCHARGLPKTGAALYNDRGKWLLAEKKTRQATAVDPVWLKDYVEPKKPKGN
jgi:hypothetical protein